MRARHRKLCQSNGSSSTCVTVCPNSAAISPRDRATRPVRPSVSVCRSRGCRFDDESGRCSGFRSLRTLQRFSSVHAQVHNHFNQERHLVTRQVYKQRRTAALAEWRALAA